MSAPSTEPTIAIADTKPVSIARGYAGDDEGTKQGSLYCGCCCDMRRAVIMVNAVVLTFSLISLVQYFLGNADLSGQEEEEIGDALAQYQLAQLITIVGTIVFCAVAIAGAVTYNIVLVGINIIVMLATLAVRSYYNFALADTFWDIVAEQEEDLTGTDEASARGVTNIIIAVTVVIRSLIVLSVYVYPHVGFILEVSKGTMSKETYKLREEASCCCVA